MKIKSTITGLLLAFIISFSASAQEMTVQDEANSALAAKNYKEAVNALNGAVNEVNKLLIKEIRKSLPSAIDEYKAEVSDDESAGTAAMGFLGGGLTVERSYFKSPDDWDNYIKVSVVGNSPMLASVNMMLSNSMYMSAAGSKTIKIGDRKAVLTDEGNGSFKLQLPLTSSLITVEGYGFQSSDQFYSKAKKVPFEEIANTLGE